MDNTVFLWNSGISLALGIVAYMAHEKLKKLDTVEKLINDTRVEVARENVTKEEITKLEKYIDERFNKLETKIDRLIEAR